VRYTLAILVKQASSNGDNGCSFSFNTIVSEETGNFRD
jgi:hypothetical protein